MEVKNDNAQTVRKWAEIDSDIWMHYDHACEKHPKFADVICIQHPCCNWRSEAARLKAQIQAHEDRGETVTAHSVLLAELWEVFAAYCDGDIAQARYEVLDAIAVLLRMDDMLKGVQEKHNNEEILK